MDAEQRSIGPDTKPKRKRLRRFARILLGIVAFMVVAFLIYFPGQQTPIAFTLATGIGVKGLQVRVDQMEDKAIHGDDFTDDDKKFIRNLYTCFAKGGRLTIVLRQSGQIMNHYLSQSGEDLKVNPRIFVKSWSVQNQMTKLREQIMRDLRVSEEIRKSYFSDAFHMGDPEFYDSRVGLYFGQIIATPDKSAEDNIVIHWRAECPWQWPSYESLFEKYGSYHAENFPLPNYLSMVSGPQYCLRIDNGLGGYLETLGIAKPFLVWSEWSEDGGK